MKVETVDSFTERDPADIRELLHGEPARQRKRLQVMSQFLWWAYAKESKRWTE